jgi:hypothetical protein
LELANDEGEGDPDNDDDETGDADVWELGVVLRDEG